MNKQPSVRLADVSGDIRTKQLPDTSLQHYSKTSLYGVALKILSGNYFDEHYITIQM